MMLGKIGDVVSLYRYDINYGLKIPEKNIIDISEYKDGTIVKFKVDNDVVMCYSCSSKITIACDHCVRIYNFLRPANVPIIAAPYRSPIIPSELTLTLFKQVMSLVAEPEYFFINYLLQTSSSGMAAVIADDILNVYNKLSNKQVFIGLHFQNWFNNQLVEYCTTLDVDCFNQRWKPSHGHEHYIESLVLYKIANQALWAFESYQPGYVEVANVVMQHCFYKFVHEQNTNLVYFIQMAAQFTYDALHMVNSTLVSFTMAHLAQKQSKMIINFVHKYDPAFAEILTLSEYQCPFVLNVALMLQSMFTTCVEGDRLLEIWIQIFGNPSPENMFSLCANILCQNKTRLLAALGVENALEYARGGGKLCRLLQHITLLKVEE